MGVKISKAQLEVWDWKEKLHEQVKDLSVDEAIKQLLENAHTAAKGFEESGLLKRRGRGTT